MLYPLFVQNIGSLLYHPTNQTRTSQVMAATADRRKQEPTQLRTPQPHGLPSMQESQQSLALPGPQAPLPSQGGMARPSLDRSNTFPTPPASASGVMPSMGNQEGFGWQGQGMNGHQGTYPMTVDTSIRDIRSLPATPATTPPGPTMHPMHPYPPASQAYEPSRQMYNAPSQHSPYPTSATTPHDRMYPGSYPKSEMAPPNNRGAANGEHHDGKPPNGILASDHSQQPHGGEEEGEHEHDPEYTHDSSSYDAVRAASYNYTAPGVGSLTNDNNMPAEMTASPNQTAGSGRATPRTTAQSNPYYSQHAGYNTPPRVQQSTSNLYSVMSHDRPSANGAPPGDVYAPAADMSSNGYAPQPPIPNGSAGAMKRGRDDDDDVSELKRRKTLMDPAPAYDSMSRPTSAVGGAHRR